MLLFAYIFSQYTVITVGPKIHECQGGNGKQQCFEVNGNYYYESIGGFEYEEGYRYLLIVNKDYHLFLVDAEPYSYDLFWQLSKKPV